MRGVQPRDDVSRVLRDPAFSCTLHVTNMRCPKCQSPADDDALDCGSCGIVFAKWRDRADPVLAGPARPVAAVADPLAGPVRIARIATLIGLLVWTVLFMRTGVSDQAQASVLHLPNLVFHEAGHVVFGLFGRFLTVLGGSLFQVLVPVICAVALLRQQQPFGAAVCVWWAGQNLVDVAPYIADARALELVLLGGQTGAEVEGHDWEFILTSLGWLHLDTRLGLAAFRVGIAVMLAALAWGAYLTMQRQQQQDTATL